MSELKVNKISPATGTAFTLGDSGDTFTVPSGATIVNSGTATNFGSASVCVQAKYATNNTYSSATGVAIPMDDTIPQAAEGHDCGIDVAITPDSASNILVIEGIVLAAHSGSGDMQVALLQDSAQAIWASKIESSNSAGNQYDQQKIFHVMLAGTTSATTFKVRTGPPAAGGTTYINGGNSSGRKMGGVSVCSLVVREYTP